MERAYLDERVSAAQLPRLRVLIMPETVDVLGVIVLAAGSSRRFGEDDKLLADLCNEPLVTFAFQLAANVPAAARLAVVSSEAVADLARAAGLHPIRIPQGETQSFSLRAGIRALDPRCDASLILLGDMPFLLGDDLAKLLEMKAPACAALAGKPVVPALLPRDWFDEILTLSGDCGARSLLERTEAYQRISLPASRLRDIDEPSDLLGFHEQ